MAEGDDEEKTEEPTQKRLYEALKRGDVVKSQEMSSFFVLMAGMAFVVVLSPSLGRSVREVRAPAVKTASCSSSRSVSGRDPSATAPWISRCNAQASP